jgi:hypothetical protein
LFSNSDGSGFVTDPNPIRGILKNQPCDFALTLRGFQKAIQVAVTSPAREAIGLSAFLECLHQRRKRKSRQEYLIEYPGFEPSFGLPLDIPLPGSNRWIDCHGLSANLGHQEASAELGRHLIAAIDVISSSTSASAITIFVPERWRWLEHFELEGQYWDLLRKGVLRPARYTNRVTEAIDSIEAEPM